MQAGYRMGQRIAWWDGYDTDLRSRMCKMHQAVGAMTDEKRRSETETTSQDDESHKNWVNTVISVMFEPVSNMGKM